MKHHNSPQEHKQNPPNPSPPVPAADLIQDGADFAPFAEEVARRAYFSYVNQGSRPGHDVQHWLAAEAELIEERNRTRIHGFHNKT